MSKARKKTSLLSIKPFTLKICSESRTVCVVQHNHRVNTLYVLAGVISKIGHKVRFTQWIELYMAPNSRKNVK